MEIMLQSVPATGPRSPRAADSNKGPRGVCDCKIVRGDCFFESNLNFTAPVKFQEAAFRTNPIALEFQKIPVALGPFAPQGQGPRLNFRRGASETLSPALVAVIY